MDARVKKKPKRPKPWRTPAPVVVVPRSKGKGPYVTSADNGKVILTGAAEADTTPTIDIFDAAHTKQNHAGLLMPAAYKVNPRARPRRTPGVQATPRRYHPSQQVRAYGHRGEFVGVVGVDSSFDWWAAAVSRLAEIGVHLGGGWERDSTIEGAVERLDVRTEVRYRDLVQPRTRQAAWAPEYEALETEANRILEEAGWNKKREQ